MRIPMRTTNLVPPEFAGMTQIWMTYILLTPQLWEDLIPIWTV